MDEYHRQQILNEEVFEENTADDRPVGCLSLIIAAVIVLWLIGKVFNFW